MGGGLTDSLANISEEELKKLFSPFGEIEFIDLHRDPYTNKCKGFAFVQFKNASEAREAMTAMNGFQLAGKELKVGIATSDMQLDSSGVPSLALGGMNSGANPIMDSLDEDSKNSAPGLMRDANDRMALMQKLQSSQLQQPGMPGMVAPGMRPPMMASPLASAVPTNVIVLHGMFNPAQVNLQNDPEFFHDIEGDVEQECRKYGSVQKVWPDQASNKGDVWVRFADTTSSSNCQRALDRRWFAGQQIIAEFTTESLWNSTVGR